MIQRIQMEHHDWNNSKGGGVAEYEINEVYKDP